MNVGEMFGQYELLAKIGRGGMGQVWQANDTAHDRPVAIKVLAPELAADPTYRARFLREARAVAKLQHPSIVYVHAFGEIDGRLFIAMPLLDGQDLDTLIRAEGPLPLPRVVHVIDQAAAALDAAHQAGLVHRDIKPSNIFIQPSGHVYLIDFGIAHTDGDDGLTSGTHPIGTAAYMAPERYDGQAGPEVDIYALTCVLYECLTGRRPFEGASVAQQIAAHLTKPPPRPTVLVPSLPAAFDDIVTRGMAKDPTDRYPIASELARALPQPTIDPATMIEFGDLLWEKEPPELEGARHWYEQAAATGHVDAMCRLGSLLFGDLHDDDGARYWLERAALGGNALAMNNLGVLLSLSGQSDAALTWYERAAVAGDCSGMYNYGASLAELDPPDVEGARYWLRRASEAGHTDTVRLERMLADLDALQSAIPGLDAICEAWPEVCAQVYEHSRATHVILAEATVRGVEGLRIVLAHHSSTAADCLARPMFAEFIVEALHVVFGMDFEVTCEHSRLVSAETNNDDHYDPFIELAMVGTTAVREAWTEMRAQVRERSRTVDVMLSGATVRSVDRNRVVLAHDSLPLAARLAQPRNAGVIREALFVVFGVDFEVTCGYSPTPSIETDTDDRGDPFIDLGVVDVTAVRVAWPEVRAKVRKRSRTVDVMLTYATVRHVDRNLLVLSIYSAPLFRRLTEARNVEVVADALRTVFGVEFEVYVVRESTPADA